MSLKSINVTEITLDWQDPFAIGEIRGFVVGSTTLLLLLSGTVLYLAMARFEHYGGDPQKRGLSNQLLSQMFAIILGCYWVQLPVRVYRHIIGPIRNGVIFWPWMLSLRFYVYYLILFGVEIVGIKYVSIVWIQRMLPILDDFFAIFLFLTNFTIAAVLSLINCFSIRGFIQEIEMMGYPRSMHSYSPITPRYYTDTMWVCATLFFVYAGIKIMIAKRSHRVGDAVIAVAALANPDFNTASKNKDLVNTGVTLCLVIMIIGTQLLNAILLLYQNVYAFLCHSIVSLFLTPLLLCCRNPDMRKFVVKTGLRF